MSLLGTYLSAMTMMGLPGKSFSAEDMTWSLQLPFLLVTAYIITRWVLPRYREAGVISVYEYLEQRIDVSARLLASASFVALSVARMGLSVYMPALAISQVTDIPLTTSIWAMGLVMTAYTVFGGIEAVIWTDAAQVVVFAVAAVYSIIAIFFKVPFGEFLATAEQYHKFRMWSPGFDWTKACSVWLIVETIFSTIRIYGTQQDMTQRYMTTDSTRNANRSVWISILGYIPLGYLFYFMGVALFVFYQQHPEAALPHDAKGNVVYDAVYPYFVTTQLPPGLAGLVVAGIFAAAMSTVSSLMNSASTVCVVDFYQRLRRGDPHDASALRLAKWLTLVWGVATVVMALQMQGMKSALDTWIMIMAVTTNGVLGLMAMAFLPFKVRRWPAILGFLASNAAVFGLKYLPAHPPHGLVLTVIASPTCFIVGLLANAVAARCERRGE